MKFDFMVTGSNGYIGKILTKKLIFQDNKVLTLSRYNEKSNYRKHIQISNLLNFNKKQKVENIIHLASKNIYTENIKNFESFIESNIQSTIKLAEYGKRNKIKKFIFFSSLAIYGNANIKKINNSSQYFDIDFYGLTKLMSENVLKFYKKYFSVYILRIPGVIDENQLHIPWPWLNSVTRKMKKNETINYFNSNKNFNSLTNIDEILKIINAIKKKKNKKNEYKIYNFGSNRPMKIGNILKILKFNFNSKSKLKELKVPKHSSIIDNSHIEKDLSIKMKSTYEILDYYIKNNS